MINFFSFNVFIVLKMTKEDFEKLVAEVFSHFPKDVLEKLKNVAIIVEDFPTEEQLKNLDSKNPFLLGLYEGIPQPERKYYNRALPDKISLFYQNFLKECGENPNFLKKRIKEVLKHEIAHHFGFFRERAFPKIFLKKNCSFDKIINYVF